MGFGRTVMEKLRLANADIDPIGDVAQKLRLQDEPIPGQGQNEYAEAAAQAMAPEYEDPQYYELRMKKKQKTARMRQMLKEGGYPDLARYLSMSNSHSEDQ